MRPTDLTGFALETLRDPRGSATRLIAQDVPLPSLWAALALAAVLNAILVGLNLVLFPTAVFPLPAMFMNPVVYAIALATGTALSVLVLHWVGAKMGGEGTLQDVAVVLIWLQYLRLAGQVLLLVLTIIMPVLAIFATLAITLYSLWLVLCFLDVAHRFESLGKSALVLVFSFMGVIFGLSMLLMLLGVTPPEMS